MRHDIAASCKVAFYLQKQSEQLVNSFEAPLKEFVRAVKSAKSVITDRSTALGLLQQVVSTQSINGFAELCHAADTCRIELNIHDSSDVCNVKQCLHTVLSVRDLDDLLAEPSLPMTNMLQLSCRRALMWMPNGQNSQS